MSHVSAIDRKVESLRSSHAASTEEFIFLMENVPKLAAPEKRAALDRMALLDEKLTEMESQIEALTENDYSGDNPQM